jgi:hypothetical protein
MYKIRFHLAEGKNFLKWQVTHYQLAKPTPAYPTGDIVKYKSKEVTYVDPEKHTLVMRNCKLRNQVGTAKKIHDGANKSVCAWIDCESVDISDNPIPTTFMDWQLRYNPRHHPHWRDAGGNQRDNEEFPLLLTNGRDVYVVDVDPIDEL